MSYVRQLFDDCANTFDQQLVGALSYSVPREVAAAVVASSPLAPPWDVVDLAGKPSAGDGLVGCVAMLRMYTQYREQLQQSAAPVHDTRNVRNGERQ
jgi:predicted TPR repeat methyltransferase